MMQMEIWRRFEHFMQTAVRINGGWCVRMEAFIGLNKCAEYLDGNAAGCLLDACDHTVSARIEEKGKT